MYRYTPKRSNKIAAFLVAALLISTVIFMGTPSAFPEMKFRGFSQTLGFFSAATALLLLIRYFTKEFIYEVCENDAGGLDFCVIECQARRQITICRISLLSIKSVVIPTKDNRNMLKKASKGRKIYSYFADISPKNQCFIFANEGGEELLLKISPDEGLLEILQNHSNN